MVIDYKKKYLKYKKKHLDKRMIPKRSITGGSRDPVNATIAGPPMPGSAVVEAVPVADLPLIDETPKEYLVGGYSQLFSEGITPEWEFVIKSLLKLKYNWTEDSSAMQDLWKSLNLEKKLPSFNLWDSSNIIDWLKRSYLGSVGGEEEWREVVSRGGSRRSSRRSSSSGSSRCMRLLLPTLGSAGRALRLHLRLR